MRCRAAPSNEMLRLLPLVEGLETTRELADRFGFDLGSAHRTLRQHRDAGRVAVSERGWGGRPNRWRLTAKGWDDLERSLAWLGQGLDGEGAHGV